MRAPPSSYEMLVSFADGELDTHDRELLLTLLDLDSELNREVWELRKLKDMVDISYQEIPAVPVQTTRHQDKRNWCWQSAMALSVAALTFAFYLLVSHADTLSQRVWGSTPELAETRILLHLTRYDTALIENLLDEVEFLLQANLTAERPIRIEVVANGSGLDLLRVGHTHFAERIRRLHMDYGNVTFAACRNTIERLQRETGVLTELLPEAVIVNSGVVEAIQRQKQGWAYIDV